MCYVVTNISFEPFSDMDPSTLSTSLRLGICWRLQQGFGMCLHLHPAQRKLGDRIVLSLSWLHRANNVTFTLYNDQCETRLFDEITFYSKWLTYGSRFMYPHLLSESSISSGISRVFLEPPLLMLLPQSSVEMMLRYL